MYVADLTPLSLADSFESFLSLLVLYFSSNFYSEDIAWLSSLQTWLTNLNFHTAKYFSVICLPYLFHSLVYQNLYNLKLRGMKEFSNGPMERRRGMKEFRNELTSVVQQEIRLLMA